VADMVHVVPDPVPPDDPLHGAQAVALHLCRACDAEQRCRVGIDPDVTWTPRRLRSRLVCPTSERGADTIAQGGWTAKVFDEVFAQLPINLGRGGVTRDLSVHYRRPVPIERALVIEAWITDDGDRTTVVAGEMRLASSGAILAMAEATFVNVGRDHQQRHQEWLARQDGQHAPS
jgi:acyl-coenzyme A thioesterase PaaI-like protein